MSKGASEIATMAIYVGVTVTAISGALTVGAPALENLQDANAIQGAQTFMETVDSNVEEVMAEGEGSTRTIDGSFDRGEVYFNEDTNSLVYELNTGAEVISPQSSRRDGNVVLSSSANVNTYPADIDGGDITERDPDGEFDCYMMENDNIRACIQNVGSSESPESLDTSELLSYYEFKGEEREFDGSITVELDGEESTSFGTGYTEVDRFGDFIATGEVRASVSSDFGYSYEVFYRLPTGADFIQVDVQGIE